MIAALLILLIALWFLGYIQIPAFPIPYIPLFTINNHVITLWELFLFLLIAAAVGILPTPLRQIALVILVLWVLSTLGILAIPGLASILVIALIVGVLIELLGFLGTRD